MIHRAETVGSMLRPDWLKAARDARAAGNLDPADFKRVEDRAVDDALAVQEGSGLEVVTDGEMRRGHFTGALSEAFWSNTHSRAAYDDPFEMFADAAAILREEVRDLVALGCDYIQVDAPEIALMVDDEVRESFRGRGIDPERMLNDGLDIINSVAHEPGARYALHLCRGNGFASTIGGNPVPPQTQAKKFRLVADVAAKAWG